MRSPTATTSGASTAATTRSGPGQYVSRFFFLALSSGKGDRREGNLLDKVWFSTEPAPPVAGHANLTLRKTLAGSLTADELTAVRAGLTFTVTRSDGTAVAVISGADMTVGTDPAQCSYTIQDLPVESESGTPYTYTVTETAHAAPAAVLYLASRRRRQRRRAAPRRPADAGQHNAAAKRHDLRRF